MTRDDIENLESRIGDRNLFQGLAIFLFSASLPLLFEKWLEYDATENSVALVIMVGCVVFAGLGVICQIVAFARGSKLSTFRTRLFEREKLIATDFKLIDTSSSSSEYKAKGAA